MENIEELKPAILSMEPSPSSTSNTNNNNGTRQENSLHVTTQKFMLLREHTKDKILNLNEAAEFLQVPKRRLYDITNVLEGIGFVQKIGKNAIRWIEQIPDVTLQQKYEEHVEVLKKQEDDLDMLLHDVKCLYNIAKTDSSNQEFAYITKNDMKPKDMTTIALQDLSKNNSLQIQVADPTSTCSYAMIAKGTNIRALLCSQYEGATKFDVIQSIIGSEIEPKEEPIDEYFIQRSEVSSSTPEVKEEPFDFYADSIDSSSFITMDPPQPADYLRPWNALASPPNLFDLFPSD
ncbi:unnamed protein product [Caenorhabditis angaria]|uniref:E2F/DP family winged-helix DNA-binding domain-containing protein n=1 Tax=Caenorhabditis angaria TaxID=860376 RepID=A0A9P1N8T0_9PELO|nr:unnamed protein product [Caenorhabditis angaria]